MEDSSLVHALNDLYHLGKNTLSKLEAKPSISVIFNKVAQRSLERLNDYMQAIAVVYYINDVSKACLPG